MSSTVITYVTSQGSLPLLICRTWTSATLVKEEQTEIMGKVREKKSKIGFSFSPGGFLFTYHLGVLETLKENGFIDHETPLAGCSAGSLAVVAHLLDKSKETMNACVRISSECERLGGFRGRLLPLLSKELYYIAPPNAHEILNGRGFVGVGYTQIFPYPAGILQDSFVSLDDLVEALCSSSMLPFFTANKFCLKRKPIESQKYVIRSQNKIKRKLLQMVQYFPRLVIDGFFSVPRCRFGCPKFPPEVGVDRTVTICVFPHNAAQLTASKEEDQISPIPENDETEKKLYNRLFEIGLKKTSPSEVHYEMFNRGKKDALRWISAEKQRAVLYE